MPITHTLKKERIAFDPARTDLLTVLRAVEKLANDRYPDSPDGRPYFRSATAQWQSGSRAREGSVDDLGGALQEYGFHGLNSMVYSCERGLGDDSLRVWIWFTFGPPHIDVEVQTADKALAPGLLQVVTDTVTRNVDTKPAPEQLHQPLSRWAKRRAAAKSFIRDSMTQVVGGGVLAVGGLVMALYGGDIWDWLQHRF